MDTHSQSYASLYHSSLNMLDEDDTAIPDFVLVYKIHEHSDPQDSKQIARKNFQQNLIDKGLTLVEDCPDIDKDHKQVYIYATHEILLEYAELLKLRKPISKKHLDQHHNHDNIPTHSETGCGTMIKNLIPSGFRNNFYNLIHYRSGIRTDHAEALTAQFTKDRVYLFDVDSADFFSRSERSLIVSYILELETYGDGTSYEPECVGLKKLLSENIYEAGYPLHDECERKKLLEEWGNLKVWYKNQPLDDIKDYFGVKIALYFAWLGFYTHMLIPISIFGVICVIYGVSMIEHDQLTQDICTKELLMCPQCDALCDYWKLNEACLFSKITSTFDNLVTIIFTIVMAVWSSIYLTLWKSYSSELVHRWGLSNLQPETSNPRPEFLSKLKIMEEKGKVKIKKKVNKITGRQEPVVPLKLKIPIMAFSYSVALFWLAILMSTLITNLVFRISAITSEELYKEKIKLEETQTDTLFVPITAGVIDLVCILILNTAYDYVAVWLTERELLRTQSEFDDSLALKIYTFQFINYYSGFFYLAFIKGRIIGNPSEYIRFLGKRMEECSPGGCVMELCVQLVIVMVGDQLFSQFVEYGLPWIKKLWNGRQIERNRGSDEVPLTPKRVTFNTDDSVFFEKETEIVEIHSEKDSEPEIRAHPSTSTYGKRNVYKHNDHQLSEWDIRGLFDEYLDMVIQYGFITLFVTAFPLGPLFALLNNIIEIRMDARKFLKDFRRPVAQTVKNIGVWLRIIDVVGKFAIISNGFIIAFSSNFVPRFVYTFYSEDGDGGYLEWSLSKFNVADFESGSAPNSTNFIGTEICYYPDYRKPHQPYNVSKRFWNIFTARIAFVLIYQYIVVICKMFVKWWIPETPKYLKNQIMKEQWNLCKIITKYQTEQKKAKLNQSDQRGMTFIS